METKYSFLCSNIKKFNRGANLENFGLVITVIGIVTHIAGSYYKNSAINKKTILGNENAKKQFIDYYNSML